MAGATTLVAAPAIAQSAPEIKWRLTSSFPKSLETIYGTAQTFAKYVADATDNKFQIQTFAAGEIVPGLQALDAVSTATVEMAQTPLYFYIGKEPALAYATGAPFGMNHRHQDSWWTFGGGAELCNEALKPLKAHAILCGNSGTQMGGWFRKEIKTVDDLKGLKFRIAGMGGHVLAKLGVVPQQIAGGDVYPALEKGSSMPRNSSVPTTTRSSASTSGEVLLLPRLVGRRRHAAHDRQRRQWTRCRSNTRPSSTRPPPRRARG